MGQAVMVMVKPAEHPQSGPAVLNTSIGIVQSTDVGEIPTCPGVVWSDHVPEAHWRMTPAGVHVPNEPVQMSFPPETKCDMRNVPLQPPPPVIVACRVAGRRFDGQQDVAIVPPPPPPGFVVLTDHVPEAFPPQLESAVNWRRRFERACLLSDPLPNVIANVGKHVNERQSTDSSPVLELKNQLVVVRLSEKQNTLRVVLGQEPTVPVKDQVELEWGSAMRW